jgi:hypothetical protein
MANIQLAREQTSPGKSTQVSILRDATIQKIAIKKFIANQENSSVISFRVLLAVQVQGKIRIICV